MTTDQTTSSAEPSLKGKKIYIIEDDVFLGGILSQRIAAETPDLKLFKNGEDGLAAIDKEIPDIILLDVLLPGMDGFQVLQAIRNNPKTKDLPVLIVSNTSQLENKERAKTMGAEFLLKALVTPYEIVEQVNKMLAK
ncbi:MAG: response regulator [bacterium]